MGLNPATARRFGGVLPEVLLRFSGAESLAEFLSEPTDEDAGLRACITCGTSAGAFQTTMEKVH